MRLLLSLITLVGLISAESVQRSFSFASHEYSLLGTEPDLLPSVEGCVRGWRSGLPDLPLVSRFVDLPPGTQAEDVRVVEAIWAQSATDAYVPPLPSPTPLSVDFSQESLREDRSVYESDAFYPASPVLLSGTRRNGNGGAAAILISPFRWKPASGSLERLESITLEVSCSPGPTGSNDGETEGGMLIVTAPSLVTTFEELAARRTAEGIPTEVITVEDAISGMPGRDDAEKLRNYLIDYHDDNGIQYLLLGGDTDLVPFRKAYAMTCEAGFHIREDSLPCDLYFGDLDGDWDANGNGVFGELDDNVDMWPELHVGRAPVENVAEAEAFVGKIAAYEDLLAEDFFQKALFLAAILWSNPFTDSSQSKELIDQNHMPYYFDITKLYEVLGNENLANTMIALNQGTNMINHDGHAWYNSIGVGAGDYMAAEHMDAIDSDGRYAAFMYSIGCWSAAFDFDAVSEHFVTNPDGCGVAWIGNSSYGWGSPGNPTFGYSDVLDRRFFGFIFDQPAASLGEVLSLTKETYIPFAQWENVYRWHVYDVNLLGDPSFRPYRIYPEAPEVDCPDMVSSNTTSFPVQISGVAADGLSLCVSDQGQEYHRVQLDQSGYSLITFDDAPVPPVQLTVTGPGARRTSMEVGEASGPSPAVVAIVITGSSGAGYLAPGDTAHLDITMKNQGTDSLGILHLAVDSFTGPVTVLQDSMYFQAMAPGDSSVGSEPFDLQVEDGAGNGQPVHLQLSASAPQGEWEMPLSLLIEAPGLYFATYSVDDDAGGNGNGYPEPGESFFLELSVANLGLQSADDVSLLMHDPPSWMEWLSDSAWVESIGCDSTAAFTLQAQLGASAPSPSFPWLFFDLISPSYQTTDTLRLTIGETGISNDVESGAAGWTHSGTGDMWHIDETQAHSPTHSWFCGSSEGYGENMDCGLSSPQLVLAPDAELSFWGSFDAAIYGTDGLYVLVHDLGASQTDTLDFIGSGGALGGSAKGQGTGWAQWSYDLGGYEAGTEVVLEFRFISDSDPENGTGFHVDDITILGAYQGSMGVSGATTSTSPLGNPHPNPTPGTFSVPVRLAASTSWTLNLYDISGRLVASSRGSGTVTQQFSANEQDLSPGVYLVRLGSQGRAWTERVVVLR